MGFDEGHITLDSENSTYFADQTITGNLEFQQDKVKTFRGIYIKVTGFAHTHWRERHSRTVDGKSENYSVDYDGHEEYLNHKQYLIGGEHGEHELGIGKHVFPFQCHIPANCPSSFEGEYGHIRYQIKIVVDKAFKLDQEKKRDITVIAPLDLNLNSYCKEPMVFEFEESYCCWCMSSGTIETLVKLPASGYCPGQVIPVEVHCANKSSVDISKIKVAINKKLTFHTHSAPGTRHQERDNIAAIKKGPVPGNTTRKWIVEMELPSITDTNLDNCRIIDIDYKCKVELVTKGCHSNSDKERTFIIGSIPLQPDGDQVNQQQLLPNTMVPVGYPNTSPYPVRHQPYPTANLPYPGPNPPYPGVNGPSNQGTNMPYPGVNHPGAYFPPVPQFPSLPEGAVPMPGNPSAPNFGWGGNPQQSDDTNKPTNPGTDFSNEYSYNPEVVPPKQQN